MYGKLQQYIVPPISTILSALQQLSLYKMEGGKWAGIPTISPFISLIKSIIRVAVPKLI